MHSTGVKKLATYAYYKSTTKNLCVLFAGIFLYGLLDNP